LVPVAELVAALALLTLPLQGQDRSGPAQAAPQASAKSEQALASYARAIIDGEFPPSADRSALVDILDKAARAFPESPLTEQLVREWRQLAEAPDAPQGALRKLLDLAESDLPMHGNARNILRDLLHDRAVDQADRVAAAQHATLPGYVRHALAIGPFGDSGRRHHGVRFAPELEELDVDGSYRGRFGAVRVRSIQRYSWSSSLELEPREPTNKTEGAQYAIVQVRHEGEPADFDARAWLEISCYGAYELWWNGRRIADVDRIRNRPPVRSYHPTPLQRGWNRLLVKTTSDRSSRVTLRFVDALARTRRNLSEETQRVLHPLEEGSEPLLEDYEDALAWLRKRAPQEDPSEIVQALMARCAWADNAPDEAMHFAQMARDKAPNDASVGAIWLETLRAARHLPRSVSLDRERRFLQTETALIDSHWHLRWRRIERLVGDDQQEQALEQIDAILAKDPRDLRALRQRHRILTGLDWDGMADSANAAIYAAYPEHPDMIRSEAYRIAQEGDPAQALELVQGALKKLPGNRALLQAAESYAEKSGAWHVAEQMRKRLDQGRESNPGAILSRARNLRDRGDLQQAIAQLTQLTQREPGSVYIWRELGDCHLRAGETGKAIDAWREALRIQPGQHQLRERIAFHEGRQLHVETQRYQLDALAEVARYEKRPEDEGAPSTLVLDQMIVRVYADGSQMEETHQLRRINDRRGIELHEQSQRAAAAEELLEVRTIHADGSIYRPIRVDGGFSMPRLEPGTFIEEHYRTYKEAPGVAPLDFVTFFFANADEPFRYSRLVVILPKSHELGDFLLRNYAQQDITREEIGDLQAIVFLKRNMPRMPTEPSMPPIEEVAPWVTFGKSIETPPYLREQRDRFASMSHPWREIREKASELSKALGTAAASDVARARAIHDFVHEHVTGGGSSYGMSSAMTVLLEGQGDRFALSAALLSAADVPWTPALIHTRSEQSDRNMDPVWNQPSYYSHPAIRVEPRDGPAFWLVSGTPRYYPFGRSPDMAAGSLIAGAPYLLLEGSHGSPGRMPVPSLRETGTHIRAQLMLRSEGKGILRVRLEIRGAEGWAIAENIRTQNANTRRLIGQQITGRFYRGWTMQSVQYPGLDNKSAPLTIELELTRNRYVQERGSRKELPPLPIPSRMKARYASRSERQYPFISPALDVATYELRIDPGPHRFAAVPQGLLRRQQLLDYSLSWSLEPSSANATTQELILRQNRILRPGRIPAHRYGDWLELCAEIDRTEQATLRLR
jgi:tetratricopeptide (TPR) repeat protein